MPDQPLNLLLISTAPLLFCQDGRDGEALRSDDKSP